MWFLYILYDAVICLVKENTTDGHLELKSSKIWLYSDKDS